MFSPNHVDYAIVMWATHRLGAIISYVALFTAGCVGKVANTLQASEPIVLS